LEIGVREEREGYDKGKGRRKTEEEIEEEDEC